MTDMQGIETIKSNARIMAGMLDLLILVYIDEGVNINTLVERDMAECFPVLRQRIMRDEDKLRGNIDICTRKIISSSPHKLHSRKGK